MALDKAAWWAIGLGTLAVVLILGVLGWAFVAGFRTGYNTAACRDRGDLEACDIACDGGNGELCLVLGDRHAHAGNRPAALDAYDKACHAGVQEGCRKATALR
ncbi:MAG: hypothetical protein JRI23_00920 [Deltaproteobacteria bacterium]|jgi:hypothetical protein|nr:hypothetical protein [Deltaproteobacteria bacterium]MBW2530015.1 hypothetical protein [Deltaproteobacteria bacterium]